MIVKQHYAVLLAGGQGTRLWPLSVKARPKQYLELVGRQTMLKASLDRFDGMVAPEQRYIVTVKEQVSLVEECSGLKTEQIIVEPSGRNTAPCILLSLAQLVAKGVNPNACLSIVSSDHVIKDTKGFQRTLGKAVDYCLETDDLVTIGICPTFAHTGYGYIEKGAAANSHLFKVKAFREKPDLDTAKNYFESGRYLWNAGMFVGKIKSFLQQFSEHAPDMYEHFEALKVKLQKQEDVSEVYTKLRKESVDYALLEKSEQVAVVPSEFDWNDLGAWDALEQGIETDNAILSKMHYVENAKGNIVYAKDKFVALMNVDNLVVVEGEKGLLILPKKDAQDVKKVIHYLEAHQLEEFL